MEGYDEMRVGLATAMGWTDLHLWPCWFDGYESARWLSYSDLTVAEEGFALQPAGDSSRADEMRLVGNPPDYPPEDARWEDEDSEQFTHLRTQAPDPPNSAEDAEALEVWLVGQGFEVETWSCSSYHQVTLLGRELWGPKMDLYRRCELADKRVLATDEPDPARRRRRALVEAAWQAVQATREVAP